MTPERRREYEREKKQRWRQRRLYANGLTSSGTKLRFPARQEAQIATTSRHPGGCPCYDCLWGDTAAKRVGEGS